MQIGESFELIETDRYDYVYVCGLTARRYPGLHLALKPAPAASVRLVTYNGIEISVFGARQLEIPPLPEGYAGMSRKFTTCCNWQFGVRYYGLDELRSELVRERCDRGCSKREAIGPGCDRSGDHGTMI
jgi:hypothetical protein